MVRPARKKAAAASGLSLKQREEKVMNVAVFFFFFINSLFLNADLSVKLVPAKHNRKEHTGKTIEHPAF